MPNILKPTIEKHFVTETQNGEITVNINLTIKIDQNGQLSISTEQPIQEKRYDDIVMQIPDLDYGDELINFGQEVKD